MRNLILFLFCLSTCFGLDLTTVDGKTYMDLSLVRTSPTEVRFQHRDGSAAVPLSKLPADWLAANGLKAAVERKQAEAKASMEADAVAARARLAQLLTEPAQRAPTSAGPAVGEAVRVEQPQVVAVPQFAPTAQQFVPQFAAPTLQKPAGVRETDWRRWLPCCRRWSAKAATTAVMS